MNKEIKPLYRKVNTKARNVWHNSGSDAKYDRNTKTGIKKNLKKNVERGLDYTPLYKFLLSKVGQDWSKVHSEAITRLDKEEAIYHIVLKSHEIEDSLGYCNAGENSKYSSLYVDDNNILQKANPNIGVEHLYQHCSCCTHTFNGNVITNTEKDYMKLIEKLTAEDNSDTDKTSGMYNFNLYKNYLKNLK